MPSTSSRVTRSLNVKCQCSLLVSLKQQQRKQKPLLVGEKVSAVARAGGGETPDVAVVVDVAAVVVRAAVVEA